MSNVPVRGKLLVGSRTIVKIILYNQLYNFYVCVSYTYKCNIVLLLFTNSKPSYGSYK